MENLRKPVRITNLQKGSVFILVKSEMQLEVEYLGQKLPYHLFALASQKLSNKQEIFEAFGVHESVLSKYIFEF